MMKSCFSAGCGAVVTAFLVSAATVAAAETDVFPEDCWGVYSWCSWSPSKVNRQLSPHVVGAPLVFNWKSAEPEEGQFKFDQVLGERLQLAKENGYYVFLMLWVGPSAPRWIYDRGVPEVHCEPTINPRGQVRTSTYPYYLDEDHKRYFHRLIREYGKYILNLPPELRRLILYVQVAEGSTGDGWGYKGDPLNSDYAITRDQWGEYRIETWEVHKRAFSENGKLQFPLLVNDDSSEGPQHEWLMENLETIGCKQGMFSHGYHISDTRERFGEWQAFLDEAERAGKSVFTRGEQDAEWQVCGWSSKNPLQGLYWSSLFATHCGLDMWNLPSEACQGETYAPAMIFFNKYAGKRNPATAPAAFCALRRGLDASDTTTFSEATFGEASKKNIDRYLKIAEAFAPYGAYQGDPPKATGGGMMNRQRKDYNDVGWGILPGNYWRFLEQIDPELTSVAHWHAGPQEHHFSRFARGFDHADGKRTMSFRLDERFFGQSKKPSPVKVRVAYLDQGTGAWKLTHAGSNGPDVAFEVRCRDTGEWREKTVVLSGVRFDRSLPGGADLAIEYVDGDDTVFHMIELDRMP